MERRSDVMQGFAVATLTLALLVAGSSAAFQLQRAIAESNWTQTEGVVAVNRTSSAEGPTLLAVDYLDYSSGDRFTVSGCDYLGFGIYRGSCNVDTNYPTHMGVHREDLAVGDPVVVYYDPDDTSRAALEMPENRWPALGMTVVVTVVYGAAIWYFLASKAKPPAQARRTAAWWIDFSVVALLVWSGGLVGYRLSGSPWFLVPVTVASLAWIASGLVATVQVAWHGLRREGR